MSKFALYNIDLKNVADNGQSYEFLLDDEFFKKIDSTEVQRGSITAKVKVKKTADGTFKFDFHLQGYGIVQCSRCLDDMQQPIDYHETLKVKLGKQFDEENETVVVPEHEGAINIAWFLYEFVVLNIPIKHAHPAGECNKTMMTKLRKHIVRSNDENDEEAVVDDMFDDDDDNNQTEQESDPRWDALKDI
ncbi:MAG: DUF177 domain-containing protein [Paludibacter sp.]|jgi:uncharacterized metal-binding protein YceD (DUF177 family)|nr:DUF177 domain-containing protein [Paludibacter sp.]